MIDIIIFAALATHLLFKASVDGVQRIAAKNDYDRKSQEYDRFVNAVVDMDCEAEWSSWLERTQIEKIQDEIVPVLAMAGRDQKQYEDPVFFRKWFGFNENKKICLVILMAKDKKLPNDFARYGMSQAWELEDTAECVKLLHVIENMVNQPGSEVGRLIYVPTLKPGEENKYIDDIDVSISSRHHGLYRWQPTVWSRPWHWLPAENPRAVQPIYRSSF